MLSLIWISASFARNGAADIRMVRVLEADEMEIINRSFDQALISRVDLQGTGLADVRGLAFDPNTGHIHVLSLGEKRLYELTQAGQFVSMRDLPEFNLGDPQGLVFAPSGDQTDDPWEMSLYVADKSAGQIVEFSLASPIESAQSSFQSSLVKTTDLAAISPPSPDPSGLAYLPLRNTLLMSDSEVEETVDGITHFQGANVWELSLDGTLVRTANISKIEPTRVPMNNEPAGVAWNPEDGHFFFTNDNASKVFELNAGEDGQVGTDDDSWTSFDTEPVGNLDPEGITYDTVHDRLFVVDGVNMEVYEYKKDGTLVSQFDVERYGVIAPEGIEFNPDSGTLFVMSSSSRSRSQVIIETTTSGILLQTIDFSAANSKKAAGLVIAPASDGSGEKRFYIVDRGIDNNNDPNTIDGKMYEMTAPPPYGSTPTLPPSSNKQIYLPLVQH